MKILVPVDGSIAADHAIDALLAHVAKLREAPAINLFYASLPVRAALAVHGVVVEREAIETHYRNEADNAMSSARQRLQAAGVKFSESSAQGDPAEEICRAAHDASADMIWMGTRGMGNFANLILGSVATKVLHRSRVPVVMVPMHPEKAPTFIGSDFRT